MKINKIVAGLLAVGALSVPTFAQAQVFNYTISNTDPAMNAMYGNGAPCVLDSTDLRNYKTVSVTVTTAGTYTIEDDAVQDAAAAIYSTFDPAQPLSGCLASMDNSRTVNLTPGNYTLVLTKWSDVWGAFRVSVTGPAPLVYAGSTPAPVPTLSEWAMILLGMILVGGAALHLHRRQAAV